jgi:hypothetical protein
MKTELEVLQQLQTFISTNLNTYITNPHDLDEEDLDIPDITISNVVIDYPDTDNMKCETMFYIVPDIENFNNLTMSSDLAELDATIFILTKKDKQENLISKIFAYFSAFYQCIKADSSINSYVDNTNLSTMEFFPAVEGNKSIVGIEVHLQMQFTKDY